MPTQRKTMSISFRKLMANRANAQKSLGPVTPEGKAKVSQNRTIHGLTGRFQVLPNEDQERYNDMLDEFVRAEEPANIVEVELVKKMAQHTWLSRRAIRYADACFSAIPMTPEEKSTGAAKMGINHTELQRWLRYQTHHDRAYARASAEMLKRREHRLKTARGIESQKRADADEKRKEKREIRQETLFKTAAAIAEQKLEREIIQTDRLKQAKTLPTAA